VRQPDLERGKLRRIRGLNSPEVGGKSDKQGCSRAGRAACVSWAAGEFGMKERNFSRCRTGGKGKPQE
jgi:hypothetical protein